MPNGKGSGRPELRRSTQQHFRARPGLILWTRPRANNKYIINKKSKKDRRAESKKVWWKKGQREDESRRKEDERELLQVSRMERQQKHLARCLQGEDFPPPFFPTAIQTLLLAGWRSSNMYKPLAPGSMANALRHHSQTLAEIRNDRPYTGSTFPARHNEDRFQNFFRNFPEYYITSK